LQWCQHQLSEAVKLLFSMLQANKFWTPKELFRLQRRERENDFGDDIWRDLRGKREKRVK
jgi:hypothetical protein